MEDKNTNSGVVQANTAQVSQNTPGTPLQPQNQA